MQKNGVDPEGPEAKLFGRKLLKALTEVFGRNILETGFFHGLFNSHSYVKVGGQNNFLLIWPCNGSSTLIVAADPHPGE